MDFIKKTFPGILLLTAVLFLTAGCRDETDTLEENLLALDPDTASTGEVSDERLNEIKESISKYKNIVERKVEAAGQLASYYKMLGIAYLDMRMFSLSFDAFEDAIRIQTENPILFYYAGVTKARAAKAELEEPLREEMLREAEEYYRRSLELDPAYREAAYALAVLYVFELDEPSRAIPILNELLALQVTAETLFVLGRAHADSGNIDRAIEVYERIIEISNNAEQRRRASENISALIGGDGGG
ncbi:MAG: tetratricopeptide repeat protein [Spirochaetia bacterium]